MNVIETKNAPGAIGPYSQGYAFGDLIITSGQIPVDPATGAVPEGISAQAEQSCKNVGAILEAAGSGFDKVVKTTCFLADMGDFAAFNEVYAKYFTSKPARSCVAVRELPKGVLCKPPVPRYPVRPEPPVRGQGGDRVQESLRQPAGPEGLSGPAGQQPPV